MLVVDDDFRVAGVHAAMVERTPGFGVAGVAHTAARAMELALSLHPDLLLLDVYLPDGSGLDVARALLASPGGPDIIVISAARDAESVRSALRLGSVHYLIKPFGLKELSQRLAAYRDLRRRSAALPRTPGQAEVDALFARRNPSGGPGRDPATNPTQRNVLQSVQAHDPDVSASEVAHDLGISRATAQRYLAQLEGRGEVELTLRYGSTGRPENRYRVPHGRRPATG